MEGIVYDMLDTYVDHQAADSLDYSLVTLVSANFFMKQPNFAMDIAKNNSYPQFAIKIDNLGYKTSEVQSCSPMDTGIRALLIGEFNRFSEGFYEGKVRKVDLDLSYLRLIVTFDDGHTLNYDMIYDFPRTVKAWNGVISNVIDRVGDVDYHDLLWKEYCAIEIRDRTTHSQIVDTDTGYYVQVSTEHSDLFQAIWDNVATCITVGDFATPQSVCLDVDSLRLGDKVYQRDSESSDRPVNDEVRDKLSPLVDKLPYGPYMLMNPEDDAQDEQFVKFQRIQRHLKYTQVREEFHVRAI